MEGHLQHESVVDATSWPCRKEMLNAVFWRGDLSSFCAEKELTHRAKMTECQQSPGLCRGACAATLCASPACAAGPCPGRWGPLCCLSVREQFLRNRLCKGEVACRGQGQLLAVRLLIWVGVTGLWSIFSLSPKSYHFKVQLI